VTVHHRADRLHLCAVTGDPTHDTLLLIDLSAIVGSGPVRGHEAITPFPDTARVEA
jgi:hypothetical protein